ncbi:hypothetical protein [Curtobacterium flaccumfaciens]|uniref:hypothetical protein n=2 Tax=Microbacteriaceae TaxID=85023 RepID=UPI0011B547AF|nr:hypothetical protein [Curtobacterium flaccumfaciens]MCS0471567.1 hypothetical protein [Curtobacterium flaccumfaciens pv. betae]MCS0473322.1 hypothetical protein [Curtobacterium flaccumfaciens pv. betae]MCS0477989.1 hypothetical protein [Curtobacterium flaccumfaciens pv. betae]MCS0479916.1 hypothetical protein [Curtobacterium flaccumfaciens pv. betae]MCS0485276.1 hypothetical protein [Curtobacterium flaccumfaciens pv. betae]
MMKTMRPMLRAITTAALTLGLLSGCAGGGTQMPTDAAGLTQHEVAEMSLHQEFDAYRDHYEHMQQLLRNAQLEVHDGEWEWGGGDDVPGIGGDGVAPLPGSDTKNSYDMSTTRLWSPPSGTDQQQALKPMIDYFTEQGWTIERRTITGDQEIWATTGDGWQIQYTAQENGDNPLTVYSEPFWTNDAHKLRRAVAGRSQADFPDRSLPGVYPAFPQWDDPIINPPKI